MNILFLTPQAFFVERGTPIAVKLVLETISKRKGDKIDLVTYHEGQNLEIKNVNHIRSNIPKFVKNIPPGISFKKLFCDVFFFFTVMKILFSRKEKYDLIHSVEESVFIAWFVKKLFNIPYIYDMDSSLAMQTSEKWWLLKPIFPVLAFFEKIAIRNSIAVAPICEALETLAKNSGASDIQVLHDISLLEEPDKLNNENDLRKIIGAKKDDPVILYIGNLETYQGIDLLIEAFAIAAKENETAQVIIIGGVEQHIKHYQNKAKDLGVGDRVHLIGPRPVNKLSTYLMQADILASPRTIGNNTPMKIYSYLHSGRPILATRLATHTQVLTDDVSALSEPNPKDYASSMLELIQSKDLREKIGKAAYELAEEKYTYKVFEKDLNGLYDRVQVKL